VGEQVPNRKAVDGAMKRRNTAVTAEETIWCSQRRLEGWTIRQISNTSEQALGRRLSVGTVHKRIEKELTNRKQHSGDALHRMELDRLDDLERRAREVMDDERVLLAIDRLLRIGERRAKLLGLDAPVQAKAGVAVRYEVVGVDVAQLT
jgi:hypothetical protein